jgi:hypothetical protein
MNEYARNKLTLADRQHLWEPVIDAAAKPENESLKRDLLAWGKFNTLSQLRRALGQADTQQALLSRLTQGCQIGADFNNALKQTLKTSPEISARLKPVLAPALGASLIPGLSLFNKLDTWDHIQEVPEHELQTVFTGCLEELTKTLDEHICTRANNMLGWLNGDDLATLKFWLDRIPEASRQDPTRIADGARAGCGTSTDSKARCGRLDRCGATTQPAEDSPRPLAHAGARLDEHLACVSTCIKRRQRRPDHSAHALAGQKFTIVVCIHTRFQGGPGGK